MVREIITLCVGQCGVQMGSDIWKQYCAEHSVDFNGQKNSEHIHGELAKFSTFFEETQCNQFVPRSLMVDLEPTTIDDIRRGELGELFNPNFLINGSEDAANNFARGYFTVGRELFPEIEDNLRKLIESCSSFQGCVLTHSISGGTGSGLGARILDLLSEYLKKSRLGLDVFPSENLSNAVVEPFNAMLTIPHLINNTEVSFLLDNEALYRQCQHKLKLKKPSFTHLNKLISKFSSSLTASLRFPGELNVDMQEFQNNLVPFPRLHFMISSIAPVVNEEKLRHENITFQYITDEAYNPENFLVYFDDFDREEDKYMATLLNYRGDVSSKDAMNSIHWLKCEKKLSFVDWAPTGFKVGLNDNLPALTSDDMMANSDKFASMVGNNAAISRVFSERIVRKYDVMYSQRAFVHWFIGEGMEEGEFEDSREEITLLEQDYLEVLHSIDTSEDVADGEYDY